MSDQGGTLSRRDFFRNLGRYAVLGVIGAGGATLARRQKLHRDQHRCVNKSVCQGCSAYAGCELPAALSAKQHKDT